MNIAKKECTKCKTEKELTEFHKEKLGKMGVKSKCKECQHQYNKEWVDKNPDKVKDMAKKSYDKNKEKINKRKKEYRDENPEKIKQYRDKNRCKLSEYNKQYDKQRKANDPLYKAKENIRNLIYYALKRGYRRYSKTAIILGCDYRTLKAHIESQFEPWMDWSNWGKNSPEFNVTWQIDHRIPLSRAKNEDAVYALSNYKNIQPLCSRKNQIKQ